LQRLNENRRQVFCHLLTTPFIQPLSPDSRVSDALSRMEDAKVSHLPVVEDGGFLGLVSESSLLDSDPDSPVSSLQAHYLPAMVRPSDLFTAAVRCMMSMHADLVAVVDEKGGYEGVVNREALFTVAADFDGMTDVGSVLVLELERASYSPGEICRIVESNDALLTQLHTRSEPGSTLLTVLLRVNREDVSGLVAAFKRHGYAVLHQQGQDVGRDELISNLENLMNYLNV
jgi:hypothetical protein